MMVREYRVPQATRQIGVDIVQSKWILDLNTIGLLYLAINGCNNVFEMGDG